MKTAREILGSLIYNQDISSYIELNGLNTSEYFTNKDYADFYNDILLKLYRQNLEAPSIKAIKTYINNHSHKKPYTKILEAVTREVKKGKKIIALEDMPTHLNILKIKNIKDLLEEEIGNFQEELEDLSIDQVGDIVEDIKNLAISSEAILKQDKDEELLLHDSVDALSIYKDKYNKRKLSGGTKVCDYGFKFLDDTLGGIKTSDLLSILGGAKQFKSTLQRNIIYQALLQAKNVFLVTLEMSFAEVEASFLTMHINNRERFPDFPRITYKEIVEGKVPEKYESYMYEAYNDLVSADDLGILYILKPIGTYTEERFKSDIVRVANKYMDIDFVNIDSINLMHGGEVNEVDKAIRSIRQFTLGYNKNKGLPVMSPYQIKRSAYEQAVNAEGNLYTTDAVRYFSEVNTSSTRVFTTIQTPAMSETDTIQVQCLLSRDTADFPTTLLRVDAPIGVIEEISNLATLQEEGLIDEEVMDKIIQVTSKELFDD
jgi:replicative DNA helicase